MMKLLKYKDMFKAKDIKETFETFKPKRLKERNEKRRSALIQHIKEMGLRTAEVKNVTEFIDVSRQKMADYMKMFWNMEDDEKVEQIDNLKIVLNFLQELNMDITRFDITSAEVIRALEKAELLSKHRQYSFEIDENLLENHGLSLTLSREIDKNDIIVEFNFFVEKKQMVVYYEANGKHVASYHGKLLPSGNSIVFWFECDPETFGKIYEMIALDRRFKISREGKKNHYKIEKF